MKEAKILVVDDELNMRMVLKAMLKKEGYEVVTAADGHEALQVLRKEKIAVVGAKEPMPKVSKKSVTNPTRISVGVGQRRSLRRRAARIAPMTKATAARPRMM